MENSNVTVNVASATPKKSNAAWICGLIGFITSLPNTLCALLCAGAATAVAGFTEENPAAANAAMEDAAKGATGLLIAVLAVSVICFILSFMGKSKNSLITGILLILGALFILINAFVGFGNMVWGGATGALYLVSGIVSVVNRKRAK